jgi:lantibiotic modifying enzyme
MARDGYGWAEFIAHSAATTRRTVGGSSAAQALGSRCFTASPPAIHQENLIAAADHPVPIDLETILQAGPAAPADAKPESSLQAARN